MPWYGWVIVGVVAFGAVFYIVIMGLALTVFKDIKNEFKSDHRKGW